MASKTAVALALKVMQELYPNRDISEDTPRIWHEMLTDVPDADLMSSVRIACNQPGRKFFPTLGDLRAILAPPPVLIDAESVRRSIAKMSKYTPHGNIHPRPDDVRAQLGNAASVAYAQVGPNRLFSENETTREIAERDFAQALKAESEVEHVLLPAPTRVLQLVPGSEK